MVSSKFLGVRNNLLHSARTSVHTVYCTLGAKRGKAPLSNDTAENRPVCIRKQSSTLFAGIYYSRLAKHSALQLVAGIALLLLAPPPRHRCLRHRAATASADPAWCTRI